MFVAQHGQKPFASLYCCLIFQGIYRPAKFTRGIQLGKPESPLILQKKVFLAYLSTIEFGFVQKVAIFAYSYMSP